MRHFGTRRVFIDIDTIEPGADFIEAIENAVNSCAVLIAVIGKDWLSTSNGQKRHLDNPNDFVRLEITTALKRNIRVIPVLVAGATLPHDHDLPDELKPLVRRNAIEITDQRWRYDVERLINVINKAMKLRAAVKGSRSNNDRFNKFPGKLKFLFKFLKNRISNYVKPAVILGLSLVALVTALYFSVKYVDRLKGIYTNTNSLINNQQNANTLNEAGNNHNMNIQAESKVDPSTAGMPQTTPTPNLEESPLPTLNLTGKWKLIYFFSDYRGSETMNIRQDGEQVNILAVNDDPGIPNRRHYHYGTIKGNEITIGSKNSKVVYKGTVTGNTMKGIISIGGTWTAKRL
jgi:hypothetical protein